MSRIAVVTSSPPFAEGGHLVMARALVEALLQAGHDADLVVTPQNRFGRQGSEYLSTWLMDLERDSSGRIDRIITLRYPSYAVRHPNQVCWLNHMMREYYDQWDRFSAGISAKARVKERVRRFLIHRADAHLLRTRPRHLFVISATVQQRVRRWLSLPSEVLYPPAPVRPYRCEEYGDFIFAVSRLTPLKRLDLLVSALAQPDAVGVRCVIAGDGEERATLEASAARLGVASRVSFVGRVDEPALLDYFARCRAVCFPPFEEDYGLVSVEAFESAKPVITCRDSGGAAELVKHGVSGLVCEPTAASLGAALGHLAADRTLAIRLGEAGHATARTLTWPAAVERLLSV